MRVFGSFACYTYVPRVSEWESLVLSLATLTSPEWVNESLWFFRLLHLRPQSEWMSLWFLCLLHLRLQSEWMKVFGSFACYTYVPRVSEWESLVLSLATLASPERVNESLWFLCLLHLRLQSEWMKVFDSFACYTYVPEWVNESLWFFRLLHLRPQSEWMRVLGSFACYTYVPRVSEWECLVLVLATLTSPEWVNESLWFFRLLHVRPQSEWMRVFSSCACYIYVPRVSEWESLVLSLATLASPERLNESLVFVLATLTSPEWVNEGL